LQKRGVLVGERLGVVEEFLPSGAVYVSDDGTLRSLAIGTALFDVRRHVVEVEPRKPPVRVKVGDAALALVTRITAYAAVVNIFALNGKTLRYPITAQIPLRRDRHTLVEGDIVLARVTSTQNGIFLSIDEQGFGVIIGRCSGCGSPVAGGKKYYTCKKCGTRGHKKFSNKKLNEVLRL
jgi:exosome complex RNA-binding protein Csl4